jgi:hypothetical protein
VEGRMTVVALVVFWLAAGSVQATPVGFGHGHHDWSGWNNGTGDDNQDSIGIPDFTGGTAEFEESGPLWALMFRQPMVSIRYWERILSGDLFIEKPFWGHRFDFDDGLAIGPLFTIDRRPRGADGVICETVSHPVPEPGTLLLLGCGLVALAGFGRKGLFRKEK